MKNKLDLNKHNQIYSDVWHYKLVDESVIKEDYFLLDWFTDSFKEPAPLWENKISTIEKEGLYLDINISKEPNEHTNTYDQIIHFYTTELFIGDYNNEEFKKKIEEYIISKGLTNLRMEIKDLIHNYNGNRYEIKHLEFYRNEPYLGVYYSREGLLRGAIHHDYYNRETGDYYLGKKEDFEKLDKFINRDFIKNLYGAEALHLLLDYYQKNFLDNFEYGQSFLSVSVNNTL